MTAHRRASKQQRAEKAASPTKPMTVFDANLRSKPTTDVLAKEFAECVGDRVDRDVFRSQTVSREQVAIGLFRCLGVFEVSTRPNSISVTIPPREAGKFSGFQGRQCRLP